MSEDNASKMPPEQVLTEMEQLARRFAPGGDHGPIEDRDEYEKGIEALPREEGELVTELTRFLELSRYFSERDEKLGPEIMREVKRFPHLPLPERIASVREINRKLMERLPDGSNDPRLRM